jgi:hypothetical protein
MRSKESETRQVEALDRDQLLELAVEAYIFGFASVEMFRTMYQLIGDPRADKNHYNFNKFFHSRRLAEGSDEWLAAPNSEILYSNAWLDLSSQPVVLQVPDMKTRYFVLQFVDFFANSFTHVGTHTQGNGARSLAITGPNWNGSLPGGMAAIKSPTSYAWIFGRIRIEGAHELDLVHSLQDQLALEQLAVAGQNALPDRAWPLFRTTDTLDFFANLDQVLRRNSWPEHDEHLIAQLPQLGMACDQAFEPGAIDGPLRSILEQAITLGHDRIAERESQFEQFCPGWIWEGLSAGSYGRDHLTRAASAKAGLGILNPGEAIYPFAYVDVQEAPLEGGHSYRLAFAPGALPQAKYFWSITIYELPHYRLVKNPLNRYTLGSASRLQTDPDGTVELSLQADPPADQPLNWLPTPRTGRFVVALRVFGPSEEFLQRKYRLPLVTRLCKGATNASLQGASGSPGVDRGDHGGGRS